jgi:hypothetical protein
LDSVGVNLGERGPLPPSSGTFIPFGAASGGPLRPLPQGRFKKIEQEKEGFIMYISPNRMSRARQRPVIQEDPNFNSTVYGSVGALIIKKSNFPHI